MNREEFIGKLQMVYVGDRNAIDEIISEYDRLNNIINKLEKWLIDKQDLTCGCGITVDYLYAYENCLDKLRALKENNKDVC